MSEETETQTVKVEPAQVDATLRKHIYAAVGAGLVPIPVVDFVGLFIIQLNLIRSLSSQYNVPFTETRAKGIVGALIGSGAGLVASPIFASLIKFVPVIGFTTGAVSSSIVGGAVTYATGRLIIRHFEKGGSLDDFNTEEAKKAFKEVVEEGKEVASKIVTETKKKASATA